VKPAKTTTRRDGGARGDAIPRAEEGTVARRRPARWALAALALSMLLSSLGVSIPNVALPAMALAFSAPFGDVQWVVVAYLLAITVTIVGVGRLGDDLGRRRVLLAGLLLFAGASVLCALAPALWLLIGARAVQGVGAAILMALTVALVRESVPAASTGSAMGLLGTLSAVGTALGPSLGGLLVAGPGWRSIFLVMASLGAAAFALACRCLPTPAARTPTAPSGVDPAGTVLLGLTLAAYALAVTLGDGVFGLLNLALLAAAVAGAALFVGVEARVASPLVRLGALRDPVLGAGLAMNVLVSTVMMATLVVGPFYLARGLGLGDAAVGLVVSVGPVVSALSGVPAGRLVDRFGPPAVMIAGLVEMALGAAALATLPAVFGVAGYAAALVVLTPGYQLFQAANNTAVMMDVGQDRRGVVSGMLALSRNLGLVTGASAMGALFAAASGTAPVVAAQPGAVGEGLRMTFGVAAGLALVALALALGSRAAARRRSPAAGTDIAQNAAPHPSGEARPAAIARLAKAMRGVRSAWRGQTR